jgi:hypothetical protein
MGDAAARAGDDHAASGQIGHIADGRSFGDDDPDVAGGEAGARDDLERGARRRRQNDRQVACGRGIDGACIQRFQQGRGAHEIRPFYVIRQVVERTGGFRAGLRQMDLVAQDQLRPPALPGPAARGKAKRGGADEEGPTIRKQERSAHNNIHPLG